ncbi:small proline-rich protein 2D-like [Athalia rosae]|uniref:small proline-rich protein 2D-like n=1 Tax=Athalia rosae TaxID=37344 RepID=UPI002033C22F|nr:small proline-rich protein 2D-like [Athalia rosae]
MSDPNCPVSRCIVRCSSFCTSPCPPPQISPDPSYPCPTPCGIIACSKPVPDVHRPKVTCKAYFPSIEPIKSVRFAPAACPPHCCTEWTNLAYRPIYQGGFCYRGVDKLVPIGPPPGPPSLCRPTPIKPSERPGMIVYSAP